ncbi:hypothetical protein [Halobacillus litoralis]|uniref:hypothetical protein n=1 Tax=Halobacillus litoralis TaxID=45668 RepID=UPI001CFD570C|nr:hypothetical protein [Halobacillus litoralis]
MHQAEILERITQGLDDLYRIVEDHAETSYFIHEVSINKKNLLKTMRELYAEHNQQLKNSENQEQTIASLKQQLEQKEQALEDLPKEKEINQHFQELNERVRSLEGKLEQTSNRSADALDSIQGLSERSKNVFQELEKLRESQTANASQMEQMNNTIKEMKDQAEVTNVRLATSFSNHADATDQIEKLLKRQSATEVELRDSLEKVHRYLNAHPDLQNQMDLLEKRLGQVEHQDLSPLNEKLNELEQFIKHTVPLQISDQISKLSNRLEMLDQKVIHIEDEGPKFEAKVKRLHELSTKTDEKVHIMFDLFQDYLEKQDEVPVKYQQSVDDLMNKIVILEETVLSTQQELNDWKEDKEAISQEDPFNDNSIKANSDLPLTDFKNHFHSNPSQYPKPKSQSEEGQDKGQTIDLSKDSWFYHSLKNLSETKSSIQPSRRRPPKKKRISQKVDNDALLDSGETSKQDTKGNLTEVAGIEEHNGEGVMNSLVDENHAGEESQVNQVKDSNSGSEYMEEPKFAQEQESELEQKSKAALKPESDLEQELETESEAELKQETKAETESESEQEPEAESEAELKQETEAESESELKQETEAESESELKQETEAEPESESDQETEAEPESESDQETEAELEAEFEQETETEQKAGLEQEPKLETKSEVDSKPVSVPKSELKPEVESKFEPLEESPSSSNQEKPSNPPKHKKSFMENLIKMFSE